MISTADSVRMFQKYMSEQQLELILLGKEEEDYRRLHALLIALDSHYLYPRDPEIPLETYLGKLIDKAYNFVLADASGDIGILSLYANDFVNKVAYINAMGIIKSHQRKQIAILLSDFCIEFCQELGMDYLKCEIDKSNVKSLSLVKKYNFEMESEKDANTVIMVRDIRVKKGE